MKDDLTLNFFLKKRIQKNNKNKSSDGESS